MILLYHLNSLEGDNMKRAIFAVMAVLMMVGSAAADEKMVRLKAELEALKGNRLDRLDQLGSKYGRSVKAVVSAEVEGEWVAKLLVHDCGKNAQGLTGLAAYGQIEENKVLSDIINGNYPGSKIMCNGEATNGMFYKDGKEYYIVNGKFARMEDTTRKNGLRTELAANLIWRETDTNGNYVVIKFDEKNPNESRVIDAKLPISINTSGAVVNNGMGVAISSNELITALNNFYRTETEALMQQMATGVLCGLDWRQGLVDMMTTKK